MNKIRKLVNVKELHERLINVKNQSMQQNEENLC